MRKLIASLLIVSLLVVAPVRNSHAYAPAIITAGMLGGVLVVGALTTLYKPSGNPSGWSSQSVLTTGYNVARVVVGAQLAANQYGTNVLYGNYLAAKAGLAELMSAFNPADPGTQANRDQYGAMYDYLYKDSTYPPLTGNDYVVGKNYSTELGFRKVTGVSGPHSMSSRWASDGFWLDSPSSGTWIKVIYPNYWGVSTTSVPAPIPQAKTMDEIKQSTPENKIPPAVATDFDSMIQNGAAPYSVVDTTTPDGVDGAPPYVPTAIPGAETVDPAVPTVTGLNNPAVTATGNALTTSQATLAAQQAAIDAYKAANPASTIENDPTLKQMVDELEKIKSEVTANTKAYETAVAQDKEVYQNANIEPLKKLNFESLKKLSGLLVTLFPFSLIGETASMVDAFIGEPQAPSFELPMPFGLSFTVDLAVFDPIAKICRFLIGSILSAGVVYYIIRFWRGVA